jgi:class 3 adenylate cyclase/tetratricopeptide (TPR) repeat protein
MGAMLSIREGTVAPATRAGDDCPIATRSGEYRKKITAVFADLVGSTGLAERLDPELFRELVMTFLERMAGVVEAHGGSVDHLAGDGVMGIFGAERAHGDDALRAVTAARAMLDELDRLNDEIAPRVSESLRMRVGINTGTVVVGGTVAGRAVSVGDPMNVAARLQAHAPVGEILIGAETHELVAREVRTEPAGELELRGRQEPMPAHRVLSVGDQVTAVPLAGRPLVGRGRELGLLTVAFERSAARASCEFVSVLGDAGVGKSRLVAELAERYKDRATLLVGRCLSYGRGITYWALTEMIRRAVGIQEDDSTERRRAKLVQAVAQDPDGEAIARHLAQLLGLDPADEPGEQSAWAVRRLLEITAARGPVIVVFDDLQWGEPALTELLLQLTDQVQGPVLIVCMARFDLLEHQPEWEAACPTTIALPPLSTADSEALLAELAGELPGTLGSRLVELAAGNPLFIEQALQMLVDDGTLRAEGEGWEARGDGAEIAVPPTMEAILAARVDNLTGNERACAECAAVIGMEFWAQPLGELAGEPAERSLDRLRRKLVIEPVRRPGGRGDMLRFRHLLLRDAVYEAIPKARRARLHERVAAWLETWFADRLGEVEEIIGYHYETAAHYSSQLLTGGDDAGRLAARAVEHLTAAGRRAAARQDDGQAAGFFARVVALLGEGDPTRLEPLLELGTALVRGGDTQRAESALADARRAAASASDPRLDAEVRVLEVNLRRLTNPRWWAANGRSEAGELARIFRELGDEAGAAKAWHLVGKAHSDRGEQAAAQEAFEHALEYARAVEAPGVEAWIRYWLLQAAVFGPTPCLDVIERARDDLAWARSQNNRSLEGSVLTRMGEMLARCGRIPDAQDAFAEAREVFADLGRRSHLAYMPISTAAVEPLASDPAGAEGELRFAYEFFERLGAEHILATVGPMLAATLVPQGRLVEAVALTEQAERIAAPDDLDGQVKWRLARAAARVAEGDHGDAERLARTAVGLAERTDSVVLHADALAGLAYALIAGGATGESVEPCSCAIELYEAKGDVVSAARWQTVLEAHAPAG